MRFFVKLNVSLNVDKVLNKIKNEWVELQLQQ
ncbi:hypothetical protein ACUXJN_002250 [Staphylococcus capitis]|nr:hypothetical protein AYP1020_1303 [Staphylococcus capitis subsp. capitis]